MGLFELRALAELAVAKILVLSLTSLCFDTLVSLTMPVSARERRMAMCLVSNLSISSARRILGFYS